MLLVAFHSATHHYRAKTFRGLCFAMMILYHFLVTIWPRVWWRARSWSSLVATGYCLLLWWLVMIYRETGMVNSALAAFVAAFKTTDLWYLQKSTI